MIVAGLVLVSLLSGIATCLHEPTEFPTSVTHDTLMNLPFAERTSAYSRLEPAMQSEIWAERFETYLGMREHSEPEKDVIRRAIVAARSSDKDAIPQLEQDAINLFTAKEASKVFATLLSLDKDETDEIQPAGPADKMGGGDATAACNCAAGGVGLCQAGGNICAVGPNESCGPTPTGCGLGSNDPCDAICHSRP